MYVINDSDMIEHVACASAVNTGYWISGLCLRGFKINDGAIVFKKDEWEQVFRSSTCHSDSALIFFMASGLSPECFLPPCSLFVRELEMQNKDPT
jgi:hypothetical protein